MDDSMMDLINYKINTETEELVQWLRTFLVLAKKSVSIPNTHVEAHHLLHTRHACSAETYLQAKN